MSNLIKSSHVVSLEDLKRLELSLIKPPISQNISEFDGNSEGDSTIDVETQTLKDRILNDAEQTAQDILLQAQAAAQEILDSAKQEAEDWWQSRREEDTEHRESAMQEGYSDGYKIGTEKAEEDVAQNWVARLEEVQAIVKQAYITKEEVIMEGEAFLVELSCNIAEKIMSSKLTDAPEMAMSLYASALARRKEQGVIVLCVSPSQFAFVQAAKDELVMLLDSQAELQIVPDSSIKEGGCIVRSAFGSIDARVDTQLEAIREQLLRVAAHRSEEGFRDAAP